MQDTKSTAMEFMKNHIVEKVGEATTPEELLVVLKAETSTITIMRESISELPD